MRTRVYVALAATLLAMAGCTRGPAPRRASPGVASASPMTDQPLDATSPAGGTPQATAAPSNCAGGCAQQIRLDAAAAYVKDRPGRMGVLVHDRTTGTLSRAGATADPMWTGSTIKVAIATTLLEQQRAGSIRLSGTDREAIADMLRTSSNDATDTLWDRYDGPDMLDRFRTRYGMSKLSVVPGRDTYWRNLQCTAEDLGRLMAYILSGRLHPDDRAYLVQALRGVADNQHWGVWAAGPQLYPGNKDGWAVKPDPGGEHWITHTVGFAGPDERYVVVVMYSLPPDGTLSDGVQAVSDTVALLFGARTPASVTLPG